MFQIAVFSDPVIGLVGEGGWLPGPEYKRVARYDEDLVKPALLLADHVMLRSHRLDLIANAVRDHNTLLKFPVPLAAMALGISRRRDPDELRAYELAESDLLTVTEVDSFDEEFRHGVAAMSEQRWSDFLERARPIQLAVTKRLRKDGEAFMSTSIRALAARGLIEEQVWDPTPRSQAQKVVDRSRSENSEFQRAFSTMVDDLVSSQASVMMDAAVSGAMNKLSGEQINLASAATVSGAAELMSMVDGLAKMPIDEVIDVRDELHPYLSPFRSFMLDIASKVPAAGISPTERSRLLKLAWQTDVEPAVNDLRLKLESTSFRRNAIDVFATSGQNLKTLGVAIGGAVAAGATAGSEFVGITTGVATAAGAPLLEAFTRSIRAKESIRANRAYFVHAIREQTSGRK